MANSIVTNEKTALVALRAAEASNYLTVGSKKYFKDELKHKRNGETYQFVIRDAGKYVRGRDITTAGASDIKERKVSKSLKIGNTAVDTTILEPVTDLDWEKEVAIPYGKTLANGIVDDVINGAKGKVMGDGTHVKDYDGDFGVPNVAFAGIGVGVLKDAQNFLRSISDEDIYGFIHPMINSRLSSVGKAFDAVDGAEPIFRKGLLGTLDGTSEIRTNMFLPLVSVSAALDTAMKTVDGIAYAQGYTSTIDGASYTDNNLATITLSASATPIAVKIPKGFTIWVDGAYATDLVGCRTSTLRAFTAVMDGTSNGVMIVKAVEADGAGAWFNQGNKVICDINGEALGSSASAAITAFNGLVTTANSGELKWLEPGNYFAGIFRLDGAMEFETLDEIDASNAETTKGSNEGLTVFQNRAVDVMAGTNKTRWLTTYMGGLIDPRAAATVIVKDACANLVKVVQ